MWLRENRTALIITALALAALIGLRALRRPSAQPLPATRLGAPIFVDMRGGSGIDFVMAVRRAPFTIRDSLGHGAGLIDFDADGRPDVVLLGPNAVRLYHNDGGWRFTDVTRFSGLRQTGFWQGIAVGDYDNDGYPDLYLCGYGYSALYHNQGASNRRFPGFRAGLPGRFFQDVTQRAGLQPKPPDARGNADWRSSAAFVDIDNDGLLDLYVCRYCQFGPQAPQLCGGPGKAASCPVQTYRAEAGSLYRNIGDGRFRDETQARGLRTPGRTIGVAIADYDGNGWTDLALANDELPGSLFQNLGHGFFHDVGGRSGTALGSSGRPHGGMGIDWGDYDNDGRLDLFVSTYEFETKSLYRAVLPGSFVDASEMLGIDAPTKQWIGWGVKFIDFDNDGRPDLALVNGHLINNANGLGAGRHYRQPMFLFHNEAGAGYRDVSSDGGAPFRTPLAARALCSGDIDGDGRTDLLVSNLDGQPLLLRDVCQTAGHWLGLKLTGGRANAMGIGATVQVDAGAIHALRVATTTGSCLSAHDPRVLVGLGENRTAARVVVRWPGGLTDNLANVPADRYYTLTEGTGTLTPSR